jgi:hypothetical protein
MAIAVLLLGSGAASARRQLSLDRWLELASQTLELAPLSV